MKQVFKTEEILFPREDKDFCEVSRDTIMDLRNKHPEFEALWWGLTLEMFTNGTARMEITVTDHNAPDYRENVKVLLWIAAVFIILVGLTYL